MMRNRPTDLLNKQRNSFGLIFPNHSISLGTKGDVETFFRLLNDLISEGVLKNRYLTISFDLYRTLINDQNLTPFKAQLPELKSEFADIKSSGIIWTKYPYNRVFGEFDYEQKRIDPTKPNLLNVFERYFDGLEMAPFWIEKYLAKGMKDFARLIISPTEIRTDRKFLKLPDEAFLESADDPLWLREPG